MPRRKSLLKRVEVETAKSKRKCKFSGGAITRGEYCIKVYDAPRQSKGYCRDVALKMIEEARGKLDEMEDALS